ncbi:monocarboxylate transporter 12-B-like [Cherax quadricarinatus]|uniref:monocarboxylate transporter 12-B-like n=1 Tax=Cherax quadricarinatus TaxID=27406 RepID=UPI00387E44B1
MSLTKEEEFNEMCLDELWIEIKNEYLRAAIKARTGVGILLSISYTIVPYYFRKRRGLANGIIMASNCGGQLLGPPLIYYLQSEYAYSGSILILGAILLNCCVGATVFHPIEWHLKTTSAKTEDNETVHESVGESSYSTVRKPMSSKSKWDILTSLIHSSVANLCILRSARAVIIAISAALTLNGSLNFLAFVPFAMQDSGFTLEDAAWSVSVSAICNMLTRIIASSLIDTRFFSFRICYLMGTLTITTSMITFVFVRDIVWVMVVMGVCGCGVGAFMSIFNLVIVHYMGLNNLMQMFGATMLCIGGGFITIGPIAGYIRDVTRSYKIIMFVLASSVFCSFLLWLFMPAAARFDSRRSAVKNTA